MAEVPQALAAAAEKAGATVRYGAAGRAHRARWRHERPGAGRAPGHRRVPSTRCRRVQRRPAARLPTLLAGPGAPTCGPDGPLLAVGRRLARRREGPASAGPAHHNIHFGSAWTGAFVPCSIGVELMPDPVHARERRLRSATPGPHQTAATRSTRSSRSPTSTVHVDWTRDRERVQGRLLARLAALGYPTEAEVEAFVDPLDWERDGIGQGHALLAGPPVHPDRAVPSGQRGPAGARPRVRRARARCRASASRWCLLSGRLAAARVPREAVAMSTPVRGFVRSVRATHQGATAPPTTGRRGCCRRTAAATCTRCTRSAATPTTSSTSCASRSVPTAGVRFAPLGERLFADLDAGRLRPSGAGGPGRHHPAVRDRPVVLRAVPPIDDDGSHHRVLPDLRRPVGLHGRLGRRDRRDDAADPRAV